MMAARLCADEKSDEKSMVTNRARPAFTICPTKDTGLALWILSRGPSQTWILSFEWVRYRWAKKRSESEEIDTIPPSRLRAGNPIW